MTKNSYAVTRLAQLDPLSHEALAIKWAAYNSPTGRPTPKQVAQVQRQLSAVDLVRMLGERNALGDAAAVCEHGYAFGCRACNPDR